MTIAIDYDKTWTSEARPLLVTLAYEAYRMGFRVVCVTRRSGWSDDMHAYPTAPGMNIVFAGPHQLKEDAARKAGYEVDIWIDDEPGTIQRCRIPEPCADSDL